VLLTQNTLMDHIAQTLIDRWTAHGIACPPGASVEEVADFEARYSVRMPADLRRYFLAVNGMGPKPIVDDDFFAFWQLSDVKTVAEECPEHGEQSPEAAHYFLIADHSIFLPAFAIRLAGNSSRYNPVALVYTHLDSKDREIRDAFRSFTEFVEYYLQDPLGATAASALAD
jgi:hypothetical protein